MNHKSPSHVDGWMGKVKVYKIHNKFAPNCFLYLIKNSTFSLSAKIKICTVSKAPHPVWPHHQHTHETLHMDLSCDHFNSSLPANTHLTPKIAIGYAGFQKQFNTPPFKPAKTEPSFRKLNSLPTKLGMLSPTHLHARELWPQTYSQESQHTSTIACTDAPRVWHFSAFH